MEALDLALLVIASCLAVLLLVALIIWAALVFADWLIKYLSGEGDWKSKERFTRRLNRYIARDIYKTARRRAKQQYKEAIGKE